MPEAENTRIKATPSRIKAYPIYFFDKLNRN
jgi:hypothetical protein